MSAPEGTMRVARLTGCHSHTVWVLCSYKDAYILIAILDIQVTSFEAIAQRLP